MSWMDKTFLLLNGIQDEIILKNRIWIDETFCNPNRLCYAVIGAVGWTVKSSGILMANWSER
jgi:hypothetical protein